MQLFDSHERSVGSHCTFVKCKAIGAQKCRFYFLTRQLGMWTKQFWQ